MILHRTVSMYFGQKPLNTWTVFKYLDSGEGECWSDSLGGFLRLQEWGHPWDTEWVCSLLLSFAI